MVDTNTTAAQTTSPVSADDPRWELLRAVFEPGEIEYLPQAVSRNSEKGRCDRPDRNGYSCGGYHAMPAIHLTYVGHAGITKRLNAVDPHWSWEPAYRDVSDQAQAMISAALASGDAEFARELYNACPALYTDGGLWIKLTVLGVTRLGFGDAGGKSGTNAVKEIIGDALRNAAMRFGVGTYLWSKSESAKADSDRNQPVDEPKADPAPVKRQKARSESREISRRPERVPVPVAPVTEAAVVPAAEIDPRDQERAVLAAEATAYSASTADMRIIWDKASAEGILDIPVVVELIHARLIGATDPVTLRSWMTAAVKWMKLGQPACIADVAAEPAEVDA